MIWENLIAYMPYAFIFLFTLFIILLVFFLRQSAKLNHFLRQMRSLLKGSEGLKLEEILAKLAEETEAVKKENKNLSERLAILERRSQRFLQGIALERYNAFPDTSGELSFSLAVLDAQSDGWVITGLYGRESHRVYAKPISRGISTYPLTQEEKKAIERAEEYILGGK